MPDKIIATDGREYVLPDIPREWFDIFNELAAYLNVPGKPVMAVLAAIYSVIDKFNQEFVSGFTVCKKGCSHCCKQNVDLTTIEAEYIAFNTGKMLDIGRDRIGSSGEPCLFLDKESGVCTIYKWRPFKCRTLHTVDDPAYCESGEDHLVYGYGSLGFNNIFYKRTYDYIVAQNGNLPSRYLDDFFPNDAKVEDNSEN